MTVQSMVTLVAPLALDRVARLRRQIGDDLGNPATQAFRNAVAPAGRPAFLHFASLHALARSDGRGGHLILEFSADGEDASALHELHARAGGLLRPFFEQAEDWRPEQDLLSYWKAHQLKTGFGLFDNPGLAFCGTPGQSVVSIQAEDELARAVASILAAPQSMDALPLCKLDTVRERLRASDVFAWALEAPPLATKSLPEPSAVQKVLALAPSFVATFLWPLLLGLAPLCLWLAWPDGGDWGRTGLGQLKRGVWFLAAASSLLMAFTLAALGVAYWLFRRQEDTDTVVDRAPDAAEAIAMVGCENAVGHMQNHMVSLTVLKAGLLRKLTIRLAFWAVGKLSAFNPIVGHLGDIGTIHFARWIMVPGTRDLVFFSNFGGSWESYLEDFITKAHAGLTAIWSNAAGFPRSRNLFLDGATDGERFKRYARQSMIQTSFWYCAYPLLTASDIRRNHHIRRGVAEARTEMEAVEWLTNFGSQMRPPGKLETTQIQSLVFGGMKFKPEGRLLVVDLDVDCARSSEWLRRLLPHIAFNDGRYETRPALLTFAASAAGLEKLGLHADAVATFPVAFTQGMHGPGRERILGDLGANDRSQWLWGRDGNDVALLIYGDRNEDVEDLVREIDGAAAACGARVVFTQALTKVGSKLTDRKEPFGFVDGISQPAMRGTYRGLRNDDPIHLVEPGEFVLGYPDNRGNVPLGPQMSAQFDPGMLLPVAGGAGAAPTQPRLVGFNGSFLVIRQLQQHAQRFRDFCRTEGYILKGAFPDLPILTGDDDIAEYIGAKMIGRWKDGSSLIRYPYVSASELARRTGSDPNAAASRPETQPTNPLEPPIAPAEARAASSVVPEITPDNDFLFGTEDPQGLRCPYGAHVRRVNPRESLSPGSNDQIDISNRHRILRVGRGYLAGNGEDTAGLMFMCLNGDIERQFEFIQQTWMGSTKFHGLTSETDPIAGRGLTGADGFTIPTRRGPIGLGALPQFVTVRGGGYFFLPGRQLLNYLAAGR